MSTPAITACDDANALIGRGYLRQLRAIVEVGREGSWRGDGARDLAHWVSMRYGVSHWKACGWIGAAHASERLPALASALGEGTLSIDQVVELARFATPSDVEALIGWARLVPPGAIRHRANVELRRASEEAAEVAATRMLEWCYLDEGRRFEMQVELPAADGALVARAIGRLAARLPEMPDEEAPATARRADALVALCSARVAADPDPDRATVVIHASVEGLAAGTHGCEVEDGPAIHPVTVRRLLCNARIRTVVEDDRRDVVALGELSRLAPAWMVRQVRYRDRGCTFPGCGVRAFTQAHHIRWWRDGGPTTLANLTLICSFHHRLVHEHGWRVERLRDGDLAWWRPDGSRWASGPPPRAPAELTRSA